MTNWDRWFPKSATFSRRGDENTGPRQLDAEQWAHLIAGFGAGMPDFGSVMPENDLRPDPMKLAVNLRALTMRVDVIEKALRALGKNNAR